MLVVNVIYGSLLEQQVTNIDFTLLKELSENE